MKRLPLIVALLSCSFVHADSFTAGSFSVGHYDPDPGIGFTGQTNWASTAPLRDGFCCNLNLTDTDGVLSFVSNEDGTYSASGRAWNEMAGVPPCETGNVIVNTQTHCWVIDLSGNVTVTHVSDNLTMLDAIGTAHVYFDPEVWTAPGGPLPDGYPGSFAFHFTCDRSGACYTLSGSYSFGTSTDKLPVPEVPEPATLALCLPGLLAVAQVRRIRVPSI